RVYRGNFGRIEEISASGTARQNSSRQKNISIWIIVQFMAAFATRDKRPFHGLRQMTNVIARKMYLQANVSPHDMSRQRECHTNITILEFV
ncbi:MAG: hypothetical protein HY050_07925, partial [Actinobacteria bacterium]|nr:hypothetical protein [Actinomycetota bacterium]